MKLNLILFIATINILSFSSCKKNVPSNITKLSNITLYNQPLNVIQEYINGKWNLIYTSGGITGININYDSTTWTFINGNRIYETTHNTVLIDTTIKWNWSNIGSTDYSYTLHYFDNRGYPYDYIVLKMYNDTLILCDNATDGFFYHLVKNN